MSRAGPSCVIRMPGIALSIAALNGPSQAYLRAALHDATGAPVAGANVRILVASGACPSAKAATVSEAQSNAVGAVALVVSSLPVDSFSACVRLQVLAPAGFRDTTTAGSDVVFRSPTATIVDTVKIDVSLRRL